MPRGLASDAKQGAKNVASDLSENPLDGLADKVTFALPLLRWSECRLRLKACVLLLALSFCAL